MATVERNVLLIKNLPSIFSSEEKREFLRLFGSNEVQIFPSTGSMQHSAFASFANAKIADAALCRLHQLDVLGSVLIAQYAHTMKQSKESVSDEQDEDNLDATNALSKAQASCKCTRKLPQLASNLDIDYSLNPKLKYLYPEPNADILVNICNALITVPKFYTQVLHLMNKMHLYSPFSAVKFPPTVLVDYFRKNAGANISQRQAFNFNDADADSKSDDTIESEMESDNSSSNVSTNMLPKKMNKLKRSVGIKSNPYKKLISFKRKIQEEPNRSYAKSPHSDTFTDVVADTVKSHITLSIPPKLLAEHSQCTALSGTSEIQNLSDNGFGKIQPLISPSIDLTSEQYSDHYVTKDVLNEKQLQDGKLSSEELLLHPVFKSYSVGEPSCRLYIKNLHKKVTENDLQHVFGLFVDNSNAEEIQMFDVRLMSHGRMKGQAFVGLPSISAATRAVQLTNGFQLLGKPMVVSFARSAKPKENN